MNNLSGWQRLKILAGCLLMLSFSIYTYAQNSNSLSKEGLENTEKRLATAKELFYNKFYQSALHQFDLLIEQSRSIENKKKIDAAEMEGYRLLCLIMLKMPDTKGAINVYEYTYPHSPLLNTIKFRQAILYFDNGDFAAAGELLRSIDKKSLDRKDRDEFNFKKGYCQMRMGDTEGAINTFNGIIYENTSIYLNPALYYCGYLYYINKNFDKAIPLFERSQNDSRFAVLSRYHILESKFMLKEYNYVVKAGPDIYEQIDDNYKSKVARVISEAYYALNDADHARYYFELYSLSSGANLSRADNFYAGMIAYTLNNHISATDAFSKVASVSDSIGQNAAYHMGQSYIQLKNKHAAQKAFKIASESNFDSSIKEDAFFNYAKLTFDISRDVTPFMEYLESYPYSNTKWDEIHSYMATAFLLNNNYTDAIQALGKIKKNTSATILNLQKASFFRAMQLIRNGSYSDAIPYLENAIKNGGYNQPLKNLANYWLAECYYRKDRFESSAQLFASLQKNSQFKQSSEYPVSVYNLAYCYFKMGEYQKAIDTFDTYLQFPSSGQTYRQEAQTRLADSYFMLKEYEKAAELYEKIAIENEYKNLYTPLQGAISYGLLSENAKKTALLREIAEPEHQNSPLYTQAIYELGRTLVQSVQDEEAEKVLTRLIDQPKDSTFYYKALLEMGMINANRQKYEKALEYYKTIISKNPISEEGQSALAGIENIYQTQNKPGEFLAYLDQIGLSAIKTADEKESMLFNSAEQIFLGENYSEALKAFISFIATYPDGGKAPQANFYIAECYNKMGKAEKAADYYYKVMETRDGAFAEIATLNYGRLSYKLERYEEAVKAFETLYRIAQMDNNKLEAQVGKTQAYFMCKDYESALKEANTLLSIQNLSIELRTLGTYYKAKSYLALGQRDPAEPLLKELAQEPNQAYGAEAAYLLIQDAYDAGNFDSVEEQTFALSDSGTPQSYWLARSFIILGDAYAERDNLEQAEATFNSIKENYKPAKTDDIADLLKIRLNKLSKMKK